MIMFEGKMFDLVCNTCSALVMLFFRRLFQVKGNDVVTTRDADALKGDCNWKAWRWHWKKGGRDLLSILTSFERNQTSLMTKRLRFQSHSYREMHSFLLTLLDMVYHHERGQGLQLFEEREVDSCPDPFLVWLSWFCIDDFETKS